MAKTEHAYTRDFELDKDRFQSDKEEMVRSILGTLRNKQATEQEKTAKLNAVADQLKKKRQRLEHINKQLRLSVLSGVANDTHH